MGDSISNGMREAYGALRMQGAGRLSATIHTPIFYVVAYRHVDELAKALAEDRNQDKDGGNLGP